MFRSPVVERTRGGAGGGGAVLTDRGREVLALYRQFEADAAQAGVESLEALTSLMRDTASER